MIDGTALGWLVQLLVQSEILAGSDGRLLPSAVEPDIDHRDLVVAAVGSYGALFLQLKGTSHLDAEKRVVTSATYLEDQIPEAPRFLYVMCLYSGEQHLLSRLWLVPSAEFNRRAYHERSKKLPGRVKLQFSCLAGGDEKWDQFELSRMELAGKLEPMVEALGPAQPEHLRALAASVRSWPA